MNGNHSDGVFSAMKKTDDIPKPGLVFAADYESVVARTKKDPEAREFWRKQYLLAVAAQGKQKVAWEQFMKGFDLDSKGTCKHVNEGLEEFQSNFHNILEIGQNDLSAINGDIRSRPDNATFFGHVETIPFRQPCLAVQHDWAKARDNYLLHTKLSALYSEAYALQSYRNAWLKSNAYDEGKDEDIVNLMNNINGEIDQLTMPAKYAKMTDFAYVHIPKNSSPQKRFEKDGKRKDVKFAEPANGFENGADDNEDNDDSSDDEVEDYPPELQQLRAAVGGKDGCLRRYLQALLRKDKSGTAAKAREELETLERQLVQESQNERFPKIKASFELKKTMRYALGISHANDLYHKLQNSFFSPTEAQRTQYRHFREQTRKWVQDEGFPMNYVDTFTPLPRGVEDIIRNQALDKAMKRIAGASGHLNRYLHAKYLSVHIAGEDEEAISQFNDLVRKTAAGDPYLPIEGDHLKTLLKGVEVMKKQEATCREDPTNKRAREILLETSNTINEKFSDYPGYAEAVVGDILTSTRYTKKADLVSSTEKDTQVKPRRRRIGSNTPESESEGRSSDKPRRESSHDGEEEEEEDPFVRRRSRKTNYRQASVEEDVDEASQPSAGFRPDDDLDPLVRNSPHPRQRDEDTYMSGGLATPQGSRQSSPTTAGQDARRGKSRQKRPQTKKPGYITPPSSVSVSQHDIEDETPDLDVVPAPSADIDYSKVRLPKHNPRIVIDEVNGRMTEMRILAWRAVGRKGSSNNDIRSSRPEDSFGMRGGQLCVKYQIPGMEEPAYNFIRSSRHKGALNAFVEDGGQELEVSPREELRGVSWHKTPLDAVMFVERDIEETYVRAANQVISIQLDGNGKFKWFWMSDATDKFGNQVNIRVRAHLKKTGQLTTTVMPLRIRKQLINAEEMRRYEAGESPLPPLGDMNRGRILKHVFRQGDFVSRRRQPSPDRSPPRSPRSSRPSPPRSSRSSRPSYAGSNRSREDNSDRGSRHDTADESDRDGHGADDQNNSAEDSEGTGDSIHSEDSSEDEEPTTSDEEFEASDSEPLTEANITDSDDQYSQDEGRSQRGRNGGKDRSSRGEEDRRKQFLEDEAKKRKAANEKKWRQEFEEMVRKEEEADRREFLEHLRREKNAAGDTRARRSSTSRGTEEVRERGTHRPADSRERGNSRDRHTSRERGSSRVRQTSREREDNHMSREQGGSRDRENRDGRNKKDKPRSKDRRARESSRSRDNDRRD